MKTGLYGNIYPNRGLGQVSHSRAPLAVSKKFYTINVPYLVIL